MRVITYPLGGGDDALVERLGSPEVFGVAGEPESVGVALPVEGIVFTNAIKEEMVERLAGHLEHGRIDIPDGEDLVRELRVYEAVRSKSGAVIYGGAMGEHDDKVTALMLGAHGVATCESGSAQATGQRAKAPW